MLQLEQSTNLQVSEKGQTDYSHGMLCLNSNCQIWACVVKYRREMSVGLSKKRLLANINLYFMLKSHLISTLEKIQRYATKYILHLPFITEISYEERLISLNLLPLCYWHELLEMVFFYKAMHNLVYLSPSTVPIMRGSARPTQTSATIFPTFVPKRCRTTTYQKFFIRVPKIWNLFTGRMDLVNATLTIKSLL